MPWTTVLSVSTALILLRTTESLKNLPSLSPSRMTGNRALRDRTVTRNFSPLAIEMRWLNGTESTSFPVTLAFGTTWYRRTSVTVGMPSPAMASNTRFSSTLAEKR